MPMIEGINGMALINALRAGREDRYQDQARAAEAKAKQAAYDRQQQINGVMGNLFGSAPRAGVTGNYAPSQPASDQAFGGDTERALQGGENPPPLPAAAAPHPSPTQPPQVNQQAMAQLMILDPETASKIASGLKTMDEASLNKLRSKNDLMGSAAWWLRRFPPQERAQHLQTLAPQLMEAGWTQEQIAQTDLSDQGLAGYMAVAVDHDKLIDNDLAERKFRAGDNVALVPGGGVATVKPMMNPQTGEFIGNRAETVIEPYGGMGGGSSGGDTSSIPQAAKDYLRQNPNLKAQFDQKYGAGAADSVLGGGAGNGTGNFQS